MWIISIIYLLLACVYFGLSRKFEKEEEFNYRTSMAAGIFCVILAILAMLIPNKII